MHECSFNQIVRILNLDFKVNFYKVECTSLLYDRTHCISECFARCFVNNDLKHFSGFETVYLHKLLEGKKCHDLKSNQHPLCQLGT